MQANIFYTWRVLGDCFKDFCATFNLMFRNKNHMNEGFLNGRCFTPWKINMEHNHGGLQDNFPFQMVDF